jgi:hypothetical protein
MTEPVASPRVAEEADVQRGLGRPQFVHDEGDDRQEAAQEREDHLRGGPSRGGRLHDAEDDPRQGDDRQDGADRFQGQGRVPPLGHVPQGGQHQQQGGHPEDELDAPPPQDLEQRPRHEGPRHGPAALTADQAATATPRRSSG